MLMKRTKELNNFDLKSVEKLKAKIKNKDIKTIEELKLFIYNYVNDDVQAKLIQTIEIGWKIIKRIDKPHVDEIYKLKNPREILFLWGTIGGFSIDFLNEIDKLNNPEPINFSISTIKSTYIKVRNKNVEDSVSDDFILYFANSISLSKNEKLKILEMYKNLELSQIYNLIDIFKEEIEKFKNLSYDKELINIKIKRDKEWRMIELEYGINYR